MTNTSNASMPFQNRFAQLPPQLFSEVQPTAVSNPQWIKFNEPLATELGLDVTSLNTPDAAAIFSGNTLPDAAKPLAMTYAGHQFGHWAPQLGDGRAVLLGDLQDTNGQYREIQLKGAGLTPYSRNGDGRAWLGPVLREYIVSEAMAALGVPTTRALAAVLTGDQVFREAAMPGAIITRVAHSHVRVGTFQYFIARNDLPAIEALMLHMISTCYPELSTATNPASALFKAVIIRQADLVAHWQSVGFIHGVMNTDNMAVSGETIDYGPCAFLDEYNPKKVFSSIDQMGRYAYANQPAAAQWNLSNFAQALLPFMDDDKDIALSSAQALLDEFPQHYGDAYSKRMLAKIGISEQQNNDMQLLTELLDLMAESEADFTLTFTYLTHYHLTKLKPSASSGVLDPTPYYQPPASLQHWIEQWQQRLMQQSTSSEQQQVLMQQHNPSLIPRNHRIEASIQAAVDNDFEPFNQLVDALKNHYSQKEQYNYLAEAPTKHEMVEKTFCGT